MYRINILYNLSSVCRSARQILWTTTLNICNVLLHFSLRYFKFGINVIYLYKSSNGISDPSSNNLRSLCSSFFCVLNAHILFWFWRYTTVNYCPLLFIHCCRFLSMACIFLDRYLREMPSTYKYPFTYWITFSNII